METKERSLITDADIAACKKQTHATLVNWWCELNRWNWPKELPDEESRDAPHPRRRSAIMSWIESRVGMQKCLDKWSDSYRDQA